MATVLTSEEIARIIISDIFVKHFKIRAGESLLINSIQEVYSKYGLRAGDLDSGLEFAVKNDWLQGNTSKYSFILTNSGFEQA